MDEKYKKRYESFQKSLKVMKDILIQYYAITGFVTSSPREVLRESFRADLISDDLWLEMLTIRNQRECETFSVNNVLEGLLW